MEVKKAPPSLSRKALLLFSFALLSFFVFAGVTHAATLYISPNVARYPVGVNFTVRIYVSATDQPINAVSGVLTFPIDKMQVNSIATTNSIINLWVQQPSFSNENGTVNFEGVVLNPGYTGAAGKVLEIVFNARQVGDDASVSFSSGAVLANDGNGTNILTGMTGGDFSIISGPTEEGGGVALPPGPVVQSKTHPDEDVWYNSDTFEANWNLPGGVDGLNYALFNSPSYDLPRVSKEVVAETTYDLRPYQDGVWYFFVRYHNSQGWGPVTRRMVKVDRTAPLPFTVTRTDTSDPTNPQPTLSFETTDKTSGVARYMAKVGDADWVDTSAWRQGSVYVLPIQAPGDRAVTVRAYDAAANYTDATYQLSVAPLMMPVITNYTQKANPPQTPFVAEGTAVPSAVGSTNKVRIFLRGGNDIEMFDTPVGSDGKWSVTYSNPIKSNSYLLTAELIDSRGATSLETQGVPVQIGGWLIDILTISGQYGLVVLAAIVLVGLLAIAFFFMYSRAMMLRRRFIKELQSFERKLKSDEAHIKEDLEEVSGKTVDLSEETRGRRRKHLMKDIEDVEGDIEKEVGNFKKFDKA